MNVTGYISDLTYQITSTPPTAVPGIIIYSYLKHLWNYGPESWVAKIAYSARVVAVLVSLPVAMLGLLDIASYGIARTLGIVDDVKAATSDKATKLTIPTIHINGESTPTSTYTDSDRESSVDRVTLHGQRKAKSNPLAVSHPEVFYASGDNGLKLAGADIFSPATSEPSSPTLSRKTLYFEGNKTDGNDRDKVGVGLRHRLARADGEPVKPQH